MNIKRRHSIRVFTYAQFGIVVLFTVVTLFSMIRLSEIGNILATLTNETVPKITRSSLLNTKIQNLATLTTMLSSSDSIPAFQLAKRKLDFGIKTINNPILSDVDKSTPERVYLNKQLAIIIQEITELEVLVQERIAGKQVILDTHEKSSISILELLSKIKMFNADGNIESIKNEFLDILVLALQIDQQTKIHKIRQLDEQLTVKFALVNNSINNTQTTLVMSISSLEELLIGENGLIDQKVESLRVMGRTRGRSNFVRNLIKDVASSLQHQTHLINSAGIQDANDATKLAVRYTNITILLGVFSIILTLGIIYFLYKRIVSRLLSLSKQVKLAAIDKNNHINITGSDEIAMLASAFSSYLDKVETQETALLNMTRTDPLTGIPNRRAFEEQFTSAVATANRHRWNVTLLFIDIDYFKRYNDHYGHAEGDTCLQLVAKELNDNVMRDTDFCARVGGEEFVCILPNTVNENAVLKAEKLRAAIENLKIPHARSDINEHVTVSIGMTTISYKGGTELSQHDIILAADKALYEAKDEGRNRVKQIDIN